MKKNLIFMLVVFLLCTAMVPTAFAQEVTFSDLDRSTAAGQAVYKMVEIGYVKGMGDNTFQPDSPLTRAQMVRLVNQIFHYELKGKNLFSDVKTGQWFYDDIAIAQKIGYITGMGDGTFYPDEFVTREQVCVILNGIMNFELLPFDRKISDNVSAWAIDSVNKLVSNRVFLLEDENRFRATEPITRLEACVVLEQFLLSEEIPLPPVGTGGTSETIMPSDLTFRMSRVVTNLQTKVIPAATTAQIKSIVQSIIDNMQAYIADESYDYKAGAQKTYALYHTLSAKEKTELKNLVQENNWTDDLLVLYEFFFPS